MSESTKGVRFGFIIALIFALGFVLIAVFAPRISPIDEQGDDPNFKRVGRVTNLKPQPPSDTSPLGTLPQQYDVFHSLVWGARDALTFSFSVVFVSLLIGGFLGSLAGIAGGWVNRIIMRVTDAFLTVPLVVGVVFLTQLVSVSVSALTSIPSFADWQAGANIEFGTSPLIDFFTKVDPLLFSFMALSWMAYSRMMNASVISVKQEDYIEAAHAVGVSNFRILWRHIMPNAYQPLLVMAARDIGNVLILSATLTFLQIGGNSVWGSLMARGRDWIIGPKGSLTDTWWVYMPVTAVVVLFGITWNLVGEGLKKLVIEHRKGGS